MAFGTINNSLATGIPLTEGGTGATTASGAATNLGLGTGNSPTFTGATISGLTLGSVVFAGAGGLISQDNANLFWDDTLNRLGIGTASPQSAFHILSTEAAPLEITRWVLDNTTTAAIDNILTISHTTTGVAAAGFGSSINFSLENASGTLVNAGRLSSTWVGAPTAGAEAGSIILSPSSAGTLVDRVRVLASGVVIGNISVTTNGRLHVNQPTASSGTPLAISRFSGAAHTGLSVASEVVDISFDLNRIVQFTAGATIPTQRAFLIQAPTYSATAAQTITEAATLAITDAPIAGTNATLTERYALWVQGSNATNTAFFDLVQTAGSSERVAVRTQVRFDSGTTHNGGAFGIRGEVKAESAVVGATEPFVGVSGGGLHASTGTMAQISGIEGTVYGTKAGVALGTITEAVGVRGIVGYDDSELPTSGTITRGSMLFADTPQGTAAGTRTITTMVGVDVLNQGAAGITTAIGIDIAAQSGASGSNIGLRSAARILEGQGSDVASASTITLGNGGNTFEITGTTTIDLISNVGWQNGSIITLVFNASVTINQNTATSGTNITILLNGAAGANFAATANDTLTLVLSENTVTGQAWREIGRAVILS